MIVEIDDDHVPADTPDEVWLSEIGKRNSVAITEDERIRHRAIEQQALLEAGVRAFTLTGRNLRAVGLAEIFLRALPRVRRLLAKHRGPFIARIARGTKVEVIVPRIGF